jgi:LacI family transcriptional regulator
MGATLKDVAKLAKVSVSTASLALNGKHVRPETRKRILVAAEKLNYVMGSAAKSLKSGKAHTIGFYILNLQEIRDLSEEASDFWYILLKGIMEVTGRNGYAFNFESGLWEANDSENIIVNRARSKAVDGAIIIPQYNFHYYFLKPLDDIDFPYVIINPSVDLPAHKKIVINEYAGSFAGTEYLIAKGFDRIGFINGPEIHVDSINRYKGFLDAMIKYKKPIHSEYIRNSDFTMAGGKKTVEAVLDAADDPPEALLCANDYMAVGAIHGITNRGFRVPEDISVFGYGDHDIARGVIPRLTTVHTPVLDIGRTAAEKLFAQLHNQDGENLQTEFFPELIERESVRRN